MIFPGLVNRDGGSNMGMVALPVLTPELLKQMTAIVQQAGAPEPLVLFGLQVQGRAGLHAYQPSQFRLP